MESGTVPGPNSKPTTKGDRCLALHFLDQNPSESRASSSASENTDLRDAVITGIVSKSFLKPLEGKDKDATRLGHQNEVPYLRQFFEDSNNGHVPGIQLCDIRQCGLAAQRGRQYVKDSSDALAFEECEGEGEYFDTVKSHPVELKCRSASGTDGTLAEAFRIQQRVGELSGPDGRRRAVLKQSVYLQVSSTQRNLIAELIPKKSERIQIRCQQNIVSCWRSSWQYHIWVDCYIRRCSATKLRQGPRSSVREWTEAILRKSCQRFTHRFHRVCAPWQRDPQEEV